MSKALFRQKLDLIAGATFTRLLTLTARRYDGKVDLISWSPCQSLTLWFIVRREGERLRFKPKPFWTIRAILENDIGERFEAQGDRVRDKEEGRSTLRRLGPARRPSNRSRSPLRTSLGRFL